MEWFEVSSRLIQVIGRILLWLVWEMLLQRVGWWIGWPICRILCLGKFPEVGFRDFESSEWYEAAIVCSIGLGALSGTMGWLILQGR